MAQIWGELRAQRLVSLSVSKYVSPLRLRWSGVSQLVQGLVGVCVMWNVLMDTLPVPRRWHGWPWAEELVQMLRVKLSISLKWRPETGPRTSFSDNPLAAASTASATLQDAATKDTWRRSDGDVESEESSQTRDKRQDMQKREFEKRLDRASFPKCQTRTSKQHSAVAERLALVDPSAILPDDVVDDLLALVPGASSLCLWRHGEVQIFVPHLTAEEASCVKLPDSRAIPISLSRWSARELESPTEFNTSGVLDTSTTGSEDPLHAERNPGLPSSSRRTDMSSTASEVVKNSPSSEPSWPYRDFDSVGPAASERSNLEILRMPDIARSWSDSDQVARPHRDPELPSIRLQSREPTGEQGSEVLVRLQDGDANTSPSNAMPILNGSARPKPETTLQAPQPSSYTQLMTPSNLPHPTSAATPPPIHPTPPPAPVERTPVPPRPRCLNADSRISIGPRSQAATAGVKVRRPASNDQYLTISTHAAFNAVNDKELSICAAKKRKFWSRLKSKAVQPVLGARVLDAADPMTVIGAIHATYDAPNSATAVPIFPNDFSHNISLVGPLSQPTLRVRPERKLAWNLDRRFDQTAVKMLGDGAQGQSFILGTSYIKEFPVRPPHGHLSQDVITRSVMFVRNNPALQHDHVWSGAPVVTAATDGTFSDVVGFYAFQFGPPNGAAEQFNRSKQWLTDMIKSNSLTMCGAIMPPNSFKQEWEIVPGDE